MKKSSGLFITLEGGEGSGKSTAAKKLAEWFQKEGYEVLLTREPGGVPTSEKIREIILNEEMDALTEALLFVASRNEVLINLVIPALNKGKVVICDRFIDSSYVYQGMVKGLGLDLIEQLNELVLETIKPEITLCFDIDPVIGLSRIKKNNREENKFDKESMDFHYQVRDSYRKLANMEKHKNRIRIVNANQAPEVVVDDCIQIIKDYVKQRNRKFILSGNN